MTVTIPQDNGQAGKFQVSEYVKALAGYAVQIAVPNTSKQSRADPLATQAEHGNIWLVRGDWNDAFLEELCSFPLGKHDDQVDAASDAFKNLAMVPTGAGNRQLWATVRKSKRAPRFRDALSLNAVGVDRGSKRGSKPASGN